MARSVNYLSLALLVAVSVGVSCGISEEKKQLSDYHLIKPVFELALSEFNANKLFHERGLFLKGSVDVSQEGDKINILFNEESDDTFKLFYLQVKEGRPAIGEFFIEDASVLFLRTRLVVHSNENSENYVFSLEDQDVRSNSHLAQLDFAMENTGYGLGLLDNVDPLLKSSCTCNCVSVIVLDPDLACEAGGQGANSCSKGDCSVTCGGGFYACCNC